jgi:hypothetical protein
VAYTEAAVARRDDDLVQAARGQRVVEAFDAQHVARFDRVAFGGIAEEQRCDAEVDQVLAVDTRECLGDHRAQAEEGGTSAVLTAGACL